MTKRQLPIPVETQEPAPTDLPAESATPLRHRHAPPKRLSERARPRTHEDVERDYEAARNAWTAAMRAAQSGRPADLAALAVAQEAYELALAEKRRWDASPRVAIPIEPEQPKRIDAVVAQELARRRAHELEEQHRQEKPKGLAGLMRRLRGR